MGADSEAMANSAGKMALDCTEHAGLLLQYVVKMPASLKEMPTA